MKKKISLKAKMILLFLGVTGVIVLLFFLSNGLFWNVIYMNENRSKVKSAYEELSKRVKEGETGVEDLKDCLESLNSGAEIFFALQGDNDWDFTVVTRELVSPNQLEFMKERLQRNFIVGSAEGITILEAKDRYTLQRADLDERGSYFECYGYMENANGVEKKFIISMPLSRAIQNSRNSVVFFVFLSIILLILGVILVIFISDRVTKPIVQLTDISNRMKNLDFSARYTGDKTDEVGVLGNNMNEMASQLERTILKLKMANDQLSKDLEEQEHIDEMRKDFISNVSHELKTPIALIQGYAEGLKDAKDDPESFDYYCDVIMDESEKMNHMVKKLMTLNQLEFGTAEFTPVTFDVMEMLRSVVSNASRQIEEAHASVRIDGPEELPVVGDEFEIEEVVNNYFSNALHHVEEPFEIVLTAEDLGPTARISVSNTGKPIPEEDLSKVWIKFYKVDRARTRSYGGSGIGLSIVKAIMDAHGREYGVYNTENGVTFWFELTRDRSEEDRT